nr:ribonuclease H-like domain-containing protein [Tanacetum cinerariifolium]
MKIDLHHFNAKSDLLESLLNHYSSIISSSSKIDSLFDEFAGELTLLKSILPEINEADYDPEEETHFIKRLLYDNSSPLTLLWKKFDLSFTPNYLMPPGIKEDDYDSERDILILEELLSNDFLSLPENESFHFDIPSFSSSCKTTGAKSDKIKSKREAWKSPESSPTKSKPSQIQESIKPRWENNPRMLGAAPDSLRGVSTTYEMHLKSRVQNPLVDATSTSPMVLLAKSNTSARRGPSLEKVNNPCWSFAKGSCWFGDACKYLHNGVHGKSTLHPRSSGSASSVPDMTRSDLDMLQSLLAKFRLNAPNTSTPSPPVAYTVSVPPGFLRGSISDGVTAAGGLLSTSGGSDAFWSTAGGASYHLNDSVHCLSDILNMCIHPSVEVGDGRFIPVTNSGHSVLSTPFRQLRLNNVLINPNIVKNLIFVRQFVRDNSCTVEFDPFGFSVKDFITRRVLLRCDSTGDLYPVTKPSTIPHAFLTNHYSQYVWIYPLMNKSDVLSKFMLFRNYVRTQFKCEIKSFQCDHGGEFNNHAFHKLFHDNGIQFRFYCPRTSQQNGKSESMIRTINNLIRTLLFQARLPPNYWTEALNMAVYLLNILPSRAINNVIPFTRLFGAQPNYNVLRVFGCLYYPHIDTNHKLGPRATPSIFLGHAANHFGYRCLDLNTNKIIISRHVTFDETVFLFPSTKSTTTPSYDFLDDSTDLISTVIRTAPITPVPKPVHTPQVDVPTPPTPHTPPTPPTPPPPPMPQSVPQIIPEHASAPTNESPTVSIHPMVTRSCVETTRPNPRYAGHMSTISPIPRSYKEAFNDPNWRNAMFDEYNALIKNNTWTSVPWLEGANIVRCMWLFRHKFLADGTLSRYKVRLVANGSTQVEGVDVDETFSPVVKPGTIRTVLSLAISRHWPVYRLDVKNAFLHGDLAKTVYMHQPLGFRDPEHPNYGDDTAFLLLYVDDIVLTASSDRLLQQIIASLHCEFSMTDLGTLNYFLGISVTRDSSGMFLSQRKYAIEILESAHMVGCNPSRTPVDTESKLGDGGTLVGLYMHDLREPYFSALKRILRYVQGTLDYGLQLFSSTTDSLIAYSDVDWAGCPTTRRSTSGYCVFLGNNLLSWSSKRLPTLSRSSAEAEYRGVANAVAETCWIRNLLRELHTPLSSATIVYCDNVSAVYLSSNPVQHQRNKHIEIDIYFVCDLVATGQVRILHVPSRFQQHLRHYLMSFMTV